jgi:hypothetical protein
MLAGLKPGHVLPVHGRHLEGLQLTELHGVQLLPRVQTGDHHLTRELHKLGLTGILERSNVCDGLMADGGTTAVARLESLILAGTSRLILALTLALALGAPVAVEVPRRRTSMTTSTTAAGEITTKAAASVLANSHALASSMAAAAAAERRGLSWLTFRWDLGGRRALCLFLRPFGRTGGAGSGELEARCGTLLLCDLGSLLGVGKGQRVTSLMTASGPTAATAATAASIPLHIIEAAEGRSGRAGRRRRRRAHAHVG